MSYTPTVIICSDGKVPTYAFPEPFTYNATTSTLVDSARNAQGYVIGAILRSDVAKIEMKWDRVTPLEWATMLSCFEPTRGGNFYRYVHFLNQVTNGYEIRKFYVSDRKAGLVRRNADGSISYYTGASMSLIEV